MKLVCKFRKMWAFSSIFLLFLLFITPCISVCPSGCKCDDETLEVDCVDAALDFVPITLNPQIRKLLLKNNKIRSVESGISGFSFYQELTYIDLSHNHLLKISTGSFSSQNKLIELHLNNNKISHLSNYTFGQPAFGAISRPAGLQSLNFINLRENLLQGIEPGIFTYTPKVEELDLGENSIGELGERAFLGLENLKILKIDHNNLREIPRVFSKFPGNLDKLSELILSFNSFKRIESGAFGGVPNLGVLDLRGSKIEFIDREAFRGLNFLKKLLLSGNELKIVPSASFAAVKNLEVLKIGRNKFSGIEAFAFSGLRGLKNFECSGSEVLESVDGAAFSSNVNLESVEISGSKKLTQLPPKLFSGMSSLKHLVLKDNGLRSVPEDLSSWQSLRSIHLQGNPFHCTCDLLWLHDLLSSPRHKNSSFLTLCSTPAPLSDHRISTLTPTALNCSNNSSTTLFALLIALTILFLIIFFILSYKYHEKVKKFCIRKRGRGPNFRNSAPSGAKVTELDSSTKTSFLSGGSSEEEYHLRANLMPQNVNNVSSINRNGMGPYAYPLNPQSLHRGHQNNFYTQGYHEPEYESPANLGIGQHLGYGENFSGYGGNLGYPGHLENSYGGNLRGNYGGRGEGQFHYDHNSEIVKPIPITEL